MEESSSTAYVDTLTEAWPFSLLPAVVVDFGGTEDASVDSTSIVIPSEAGGFCIFLLKRDLRKEEPLFRVLARGLCRRLGGPDSVGSRERIARGESATR
jgi:hypothetical protein